MTAYVFGYGSLVNRATHDYVEAHAARLPGWRRAWRHVEGRTVAFLTAVPDPASELDGLVAGVRDDAWEALDQREKSYLREVASNVAHELGEDVEVRLYHAPEHLHRPHSAHHPILLSYLDTVVQGYFREFGESGVRRFFETTDGWDAPVLNDRAAPRYPRHQRLSGEERELADSCLRDVGVTFNA